MKQMKRISALFLALMMLLSLCACGSYRSSKSSGQAAVPAVEAGGSYNTAYYSDGVAEEAAMMGIFMTWQRSISSWYRIKQEPYHVLPLHFLNPFILNSKPSHSCECVVTWM